jgi:hypothetical protein
MELQSSFPVPPSSHFKVGDLVEYQSEDDTIRACDLPRRTGVISYLDDKSLMVLVIEDFDLKDHIRGIRSYFTTTSRERLDYITVEIL